MYRNCWDNSPYTQNSVKRDGIKVQKVIQKLCLMYRLHISCSCPAMRSIPRYFGPICMKTAFQSVVLGENVKYNGPIRQKALFQSDFFSNCQKRIGRFCMNTLISSGSSVNLPPSLWLQKTIVLLVFFRECTNCAKANATCETRVDVIPASEKDLDFVRAHYSVMK